MRLSKLYFERTKSEPGYHNRKCGVELELKDGDDAMEALNKAEKFVALGLNEALPDGQQLECVLKSCKKRKVPKSDLPF
jgi:hypothetical protein